MSEIKTIPHVPLFHPFVERLIGTIRREYLDRTLFWTMAGSGKQDARLQTISMSIACIQSGKGERRTKTRACRDQSPTSNAMDGNATAEAFITRQRLPDSPKHSCSLWAHGGTSVGKPHFQ